MKLKVAMVQYDANEPNIEFQYQSGYEIYKRS